jgi:hypothetical protein
VESGSLVMEVQFWRGREFLYNFDLGLCGGHMEQGACHNVALPIYIKTYLKAKEELRKLKYFTIAKNIIFKKSSKRIQDIIITL